MQTYVLMHEDEKVAVIGYSDDLSTIYSVKLNEVNAVHYPIGVNDNTSLQNWLLSRCIPVTREGLADELFVSAKRLSQLLLLNKGLSLTDHYWLCSTNSEEAWSDINFFENDFEAKWSYNFSDDMRHNCITPSITLNGDLRKKWVISKDGRRLLLKECRGNSTRQCVAECFASLIHARQDKVNFVDYKPVMIDGKVGTICENFVTKDTEFVSASNVYDLEKKNNSMSMYEHYISICEKNGVRGIRNFLEYQIMTDFLITNKDRHFNNFGIIRDAKTLEWLSPAPIFDNGNSLFFDEPCVVNENELLNISITSFLKKEVQLLKYVRNRRLVELDKLPSSDELFQLLEKYDSADEKTWELICKAYEIKVKLLEDFQSGADLWEYKYIYKH